MYIRIKRTQVAHNSNTSGQIDEYDRIDATELLKHLALHDSEEIDDDVMSELHSYLASGRAPEGSMGLSHLDGFMTAVTASRDGVAVLNWMPAVWVDEEPEFEDMAEAEMVFAAMARRCRQITMQLHCTGELLCVLERSSQGEVFAGAWCRGFIQGIMVTPEQWAPAFEHELGRYVLIPIATIAADEQLWGRLFSPLQEEEPWCRSADLVLAREHPFSASELPDVWSDLRADAAPDADTTGMSSAEDEEDGDATPAPASATSRSGIGEGRGRPRLNPKLFERKAKG